MADDDLTKTASMLEAFCDALPALDPTNYAHPSAVTPRDPMWELYCHATDVWDALVDENERKEGPRPEFVHAARAMLVAVPAPAVDRAALIDWVREDLDRTDERDEEVVDALIARGVVTTGQRGEQHT